LIASRARRRLRRRHSSLLNIPESRVSPSSNFDRDRWRSRSKGIFHRCEAHHETICNGANTQGNGPISSSQARSKDQPNRGNKEENFRDWEAARGGRRAVYLVYPLIGGGIARN
jgi:hypothetical protein